MCTNRRKETTPHYFDCISFNKHVLVLGFCLVALSSAWYLILIQYESCRFIDSLLQVVWQHEKLVGLRVILKLQIADDVC